MAADAAEAPFYAKKEQKPPWREDGFRSSGGGIRTRDLRVMSPTSYLTAPPRVAVENIAMERKASTWLHRVSQGLQQLVDARIVRCVLHNVGPDDRAVRLDDRSAAQLGDVSDRPAHADA